MEKAWIILIAVATFIAFNFLYSKTLKVYVKNTFGKKWLSVWGNKAYFWQNSIFVSTAGTFLIIGLLKWFNILHF